MVKTATSQNGDDRSKRRHRNGDRNGYIQNGDKPNNTYSSSEVYIIDRRLYTYGMQLLSYMKKVQYSIARKA